VGERGGGHKQTDRHNKHNTHTSAIGQQGNASRKMGEKMTREKEKKTRGGVTFKLHKQYTGYRCKYQKDKEKKHLAKTNTKNKTRHKDCSHHYIQNMQKIRSRQKTR
jgi:hypothetical protein